MAAPLAHFEIMSENPDRMQAFYGKVFDWSFDNSSMPGYTLIQTGAAPAGGLMKRPPQAPESRLNAYFQVQSIDETAKKVERAGGRVVVPKTHIPNVGSYAFFTDPEGVIVGIFEK
jgi:predicted enzyme related to lactoylglutathione lyase